MCSLLHSYAGINLNFFPNLTLFFFRYQQMTNLPLKNPNTVHKLGEDLLTFMEIIYTYIHLDQRPETMREINLILNAINYCLATSYNTLGTNFTKFRPYLPLKVNILRAKIHRNCNLIYAINCNVDLFKITLKQCTRVSIELLIILQNVKHFIAVKLTGEKAK